MNRDEAAFESTLVSVLENRPEQAEILVPHDGSYGDPFDLGDEVRFVVASEKDVLSMLCSGVRAARGEFVHILADGLRGTELWTEEPCQMLARKEVACVAPMIVDLSERERVVALGWKDTATCLRVPLGAGSAAPKSSELLDIRGAYLQASFWRRAVIQELLELPLGTVPSVVDYVLAHSLWRAGWECQVCLSSRVAGAPIVTEPRDSSFACGQWMQEVRSAVCGDQTWKVVASAVAGVLLHPWRLTQWGQSLGRIASFFSDGTAGSDLFIGVRELAVSHQVRSTEAPLLKLRSEQRETSSAYRRAA